MGFQNLVAHYCNLSVFFNIIEIYGYGKMKLGYRSSNSNRPNGSPWKYLKSYTAHVRAGGGGEDGVEGRHTEFAHQISAKSN